MTRTLAAVGCRFWPSPFWLRSLDGLSRSSRHRLAGRPGPKAARDRSRLHMRVRAAKPAAPWSGVSQGRARPRSRIAVWMKRGADIGLWRAGLGPDSLAPGVRVARARAAADGPGARRKGPRRREASAHAWFATRRDRRASAPLILGPRRRRAGANASSALPVQARRAGVVQRLAAKPTARRPAPSGRRRTASGRRARPSARSGGCAARRSRRRPRSPRSAVASAPARRRAPVQAFQGTAGQDQRRGQKEREARGVPAPEAGQQAGGDGATRTRTASSRSSVRSSGCPCRWGWGRRGPGGPPRVRSKPCLFTLLATGLVLGGRSA